MRNAPCSVYYPIPFVLLGALHEHDRQRPRLHARMGQHPMDGTSMFRATIVSGDYPVGEDDDTFVEAEAFLNVGGAGGSARNTFNITNT